MTLGIENLKRIKEEINIGLHKTQSFIKDLKPRNSDLAFIAELFLEELLTEIYSYKNWYFRNLNFDKVNAPAIDLIDKKNRICFQITIIDSSGNINSKIKDTLTSFYKRKYDKEYDKLFILFASGINKKSKVNNVPLVELEGKPVLIKEELFNKTHILSLTDLFNEVYDDYKSKDLQRILEVLYKIPSRPKKETIAFTTSNYIERAFSSSNGINGTLDNLIQSKERILLVGKGGLGKTIEVNRVQSEWSKKKDWFCFRINFLDYTDNLENFIDRSSACRNWRNVPPHIRTLFILDGLDEVNKLELNKVKNEIKQFCDSFPHINILLTCRINELQLLKSLVNNQLFNKIELELLTDNQVQKYIKQHSSNSSDVLAHIIEHEFVSVLKNPFYLINGFELFESKNKPKSKNEFFEFLVNKRIEKEKEKEGDIALAIDENELEIEAKSNYLALVMLYAGTYNILNKDFLRIIQSGQVRDGSQRLFLIRKNSKEWFFEHKIFQDFFAANYFKERDFGVAEDFLKRNRRIGTNSSEFIDFLSPIIDRDRYYCENIISKNIKTSMVKSKFLPEEFNVKQRNQRFKEIFDKHKKEETLIWRNSYNFQDIAEYVDLNNNPKLIQFLISEIDSKDKVIQSVANCVHLLGELKSPQQFPINIRVVFLALLEIVEYAKYGISRIIIDSFSKWKVFDTEIKNSLIQNESLFNSEAPITTFCYYLADGKFNDLTAELILKFLNSFDKQRIISSEYSLYEMIKILSNEELIRLIQELTPLDLSNKSNYRGTDLYKLLNQEAISRYKPQTKIEKVISNFVYASFEFHDENNGREFISFYEKTDLVFTSFKSYFREDLKSNKKKRRELFIVPALLADTQCLDWVVALYSRNPFGDEMMWNFLIALSITENSDGRTYFMKQIKPLTQAKFEPKTQPWDIFNKSKKELWYKVILDQKLALDLINTCFNSIGKTNLTRKEIIAKQFDKEEQFHNVKLATGLKIISRNSDDKINKVEFIKKFSDRIFWEGFQIQEHYNLITHKEINEANINWIHNWCIKVLPNVQFKNAITKKQNDKYTYIYQTYFFAKFAAFLNFQNDNIQYLELTNFIGFADFNRNINNQTTKIKIYDYLKKNVSIEKLKARILYNLEKNNLISWVLDTHVAILEDEGWIEGTNQLIKLLLNPEIKKYHKSRIFRAYKNLNGESNELVPLLDSLIFEGDYSYLDWDIIDYLIQNGNSVVISYLKGQALKDNIDKLRIGNYLLRANQEVAFQVITQNLKELKNHTENESMITAVSQVKISYFNENQLSNFLIDILRIYIKNDFGSSGYTHMLQVTFNKLYDVITKTTLDANAIINTIKELLDINEINETSRRARYDLYELEEKVSIHLDKGCQISEAIKELKTLGITYEF